ncbi:hypothetical protein [Methylobacterium sp. ARG-1]|uniref:hypothetical protein n=1 Tax=Methylobacterium sp. ARG-1 TaxID=1692501 RepID=UPI000ABCAA3E|nr:hypothetical protein [Methylobacterium sp. ARG-1]
MVRITADPPFGKAGRTTGDVPLKGRPDGRRAARHQAHNIPATPVSGDDAALAQMVDSLRAHLPTAGLDQGEMQQVGARLPASLVRQAKRRTGLSSNTDLLTVALANLALEDAFADAFEAAHGQLDPELDIGF